jgi:ATP-dependent Clp protease ATP-binding subunit ClpC
MGQPIKNTVNYEKYFSKELTDLLTYIKNDFLTSYPMSSITTEAFFAAALSQQDTMLYKVVNSYLNTFSITLLVDKFIGIIQEKTLSVIKPGRTIDYSQELKNLFQKSYSESTEQNNKFITSDHVLLALLKIGNGSEYNKLKGLFFSENVNYDIILEQSSKIHDITESVLNTDIEDLQDDHKDTFVISTEELDNISDILKQNSVLKRDKDKKNNKNKGDLQYCTNLNKLAKEKVITDIVGRDKEIEQIIKILNRRKSNNVLLIGETGVGKTALIEGLASKIEQGIAPSIISDKTILRLNFGEIIGGTQFRGVFEERFSTLFKELTKREHTILFIDNFHRILTERKDDDFNITSLLLPYLQEGSFNVIVCSTYEGYRKSFEKNSELLSRFQRVDLTQPTIENCKDILIYQKDFYEEFHNVTFSDEVIETILTLSRRYITDKTLPTSAIDILDEIGSQKNIERHETEELKKTRSELLLAIKEGNKDKELDARLTLTKLNNKKNRKEIIEITIDDVYKAVASHTNLPINKINTSEKRLISNIDKILNSNIIGQENAIKCVSQAIKRSKVGLAPQNKPIASFLCIGKTGVGKTLMAKILAKEIFGDEKYLVRFDMSEYADKTSVNKLIGSSAGYVGYNDGGLLTEAVKSKKNCVLLIDEIEKADEQVYNIFLQILDDGFLTDNMGKKVDFTNTIILLTSNIGTKLASETKTIGFYKNDDDNRKDIIEKELKKKFPPEFINRLSNVVYFNSLTNDNLKEIIKLEINKLNKRLNDIKMSLQYNEEVIEYIVKYIEKDIDYGARPIIRAIQELIENKITDLILENEFENNHTFNIEVNNNDIVLK